MNGLGLGWKSLCAPILWAPKAATAYLSAKWWQWWWWQFIPSGLFRHFPQYIDCAQHPTHIAHFSPGVMISLLVTILINLSTIYGNEFKINIKMGKGMRNEKKIGFEFENFHLARNLLRFSTRITFPRGASCSHGCSRHLDYQHQHYFHHNFIFSSSHFYEGYFEDHFSKSIYI